MHEPAQLTPRQRLRSIFSGSVGNLACSLLVYLWMPDTRRYSLIDADARGAPA